MNKLILFLILGITIVNETQGQFTRYVVKLKNKGGTPFTIANPSAYLSARAIDRRTKYNIAIDSTDLPATPSFITQIRNVPNVTILNVSKWLNSVSILTTDANAINTINAFSFVQSVNPIAAKNVEQGRANKFEKEIITTELPLQRTDEVTADFFNYGANSYREIHLHNGEFLHNIGLRGQGMQIAMLDAGFFNYTSLKAFDSVNMNGQVLNTWDFVARESSVVEDNSHGMLCFSTIAANIPGQFVGKAPKANFYLFRTEDATPEDPIEEHNWACGAERADSIGADIISTSLGYSTFDNATFNHTYNDMNGNTTMAAIAADLAAKKGLLVFASNGNSGNNAWHFLGTPADADSVIAVGSVDTLGAVASSSSYGPSSDGQIKPDVASVGVSAIVQGTGNTISTASGTSLAAPNMAGLGTCLWQGFPEFNNMKIIAALRKAGSIFANPNDRIGYGIPNMKSAFSNLLIDFATSTATTDTCTASLNWTSKDVSSMKYEIERKLPGQSVYSKVGEINPMAGAILSNHTYQFSNTIINSADGIVSYRIRQIIDTATASFMAVYIDTANITITGSCFANLLIGFATSNATINACEVILNWTSKDIDAMKYEIERKAPGDANFIKIADVTPSAGQILSNHTYQFINNLVNVNAGTISYRIRQIIDTTMATFSAVYIDTANVIVGAGCTATAVGNSTVNKDKITVLPNPTKGNAILVVDTRYAINNMPIAVYDMKGSLMFQLNSSKAAASSNIDLPTDRLARGKYIIKVYNNQKLIGTAKLLKL